MPPDDENTKKVKNMWTRFWDMHSGGGQKLGFALLFIEAPQAEAELIFQNRFGRNPNRVTCTCCGPDYSISEENDLTQATGFHRHCKYVYRDADGNEVPDKNAFVPGRGVAKGVTGGYEDTPNDGKWGSGRPVIPLEEYIKQPDVCVIYAKDIEPAERNGELEEEGYVWIG